MHGWSLKCGIRKGPLWADSFPFLSTFSVHDNLIFADVIWNSSSRQVKRIKWRYEKGERRTIRLSVAILVRVKSGKSRPPANTIANNTTFFISGALFCTLYLYLFAVLHESMMVLLTRTCPSMRLDPLGKAWCFICWEGMRIDRFLSFQPLGSP